MYSLDFKIADKVVYRRENSSIQAKVAHDELTKIRFYPAGLASLSGPAPSGWIHFSLWSGPVRPDSLLYLVRFRPAGFTSLSGLVPSDRIDFSLWFGPVRLD
jgi:hypothetical protein